MEDHTATDYLEPDGYLQPRRYREHFRCNLCGNEYSRVTTKPGRKPPSCPDAACKVQREEIARERAQERVAAMIEEGRPPAHIGDKPIVKAVDQTAQIVMKDHGLTDLRDNIREGEIAAPKLPAAQQRAADSFFSGSEVARMAGPRFKNRMDMLGRRAMAGAFKQMALNPKAILPQQQGEPALRLVRTEKLK
jgi:hypothetical protein